MDIHFKLTIERRTSLIYITTTITKVSCVYITNVTQMGEFREEHIRAHSEVILFLT